MFAALTRPTTLYVPVAKLTEPAERGAISNRCSTGPLNNTVSE